jgi:cardiolipin synthase
VTDAGAGYAEVSSQRTPFRPRSWPPRFVDGNLVTLLRDGNEAYPAMLEAIAAARRQVLLEMFWFGSDRAGRRFAAALLAARERGVEVGLLYDAVGSRDTDPSLFGELRSGGCTVVEFGPLIPWRAHFRPEGLTRRDHRKILVVDGEIGFTGGINVADEWLPKEEGGGGWRDDMLRVEGPVVRGLVAMQRSAWRRAGGPPLGAAPGYERGPRLHVTDQMVRVLGESYFRNRRQISQAYIAELEHAKERAWVQNAYFVPDRRVRRAFRRAAQRGVDVRVIVPGVSDVELVRVASKATWASLLSRGVRLFEYQRGVLHSKSAVIDGRWSTVGTFNLDYLSLRSNLEVNIAVLDARFGEQMEQSFRLDMADSKEVDAEAFHGRSLGSRALEQIAYRFRKLL